MTENQTYFTKRRQLSFSEHVQWSVHEWSEAWFNAICGNGQNFACASDSPLTLRKSIIWNISLIHYQVVNCALLTMVKIFPTKFYAHYMYHMYMWNESQRINTFKTRTNSTNCGDGSLLHILAARKAQGNQLSTTVSNKTAQNVNVHVPETDKVHSCWTGKYLQNADSVICPPPPVQEIFKCWRPEHLDAILSKATSSIYIIESIEIRLVNKVSENVHYSNEIGDLVHGREKDHMNSSARGCVYNNIIIIVQFFFRITWTPNLRTRLSNIC